VLQVLGAVTNGSKLENVFANPQLVDEACLQQASFARNDFTLFFSIILLITTYK